MPPTFRLLLPLALLALASGCVSAPRTGPVEASRYHLGSPITPGSFSIQPADNGPPIGPEFQIYADAVGAELSRLGFGPGVTGSNSTYVASVSFVQMSAGQYRSRPPISIGLGGGSFGGNVGVGAGGSFGIGSKTYEMVTSELALQLRRRSDNVVVWEGRAHTSGALSSPDMQAAVAAPRLAHGLLRDFPGESGITITTR